MNLNCRSCGELFTEGDHDICAGCSRPEHLSCGTIEPVWRAGDVHFYFFCSNCNSYHNEWEAQ